MSALVEQPARYPRNLPEEVPAEHSLHGSSDSSFFLCRVHEEGSRNGNRSPGDSTYTSREGQTSGEPSTNMVRSL
jgi:hypothetical protein